MVKQLVTAVQVLITEKKDLKPYILHLLGSMKCDITFLTLRILQKEFKIEQQNEAQH